MLRKKQILVLSELRSNSRQSIAGIAKKLNMPSSTVHDIYKELKPCIAKNTSLINFEKLGYSLRVDFIFRISNNKIIDNFLIKNKNINSLSRINNRHTILAECFFKNIKDAYEFKENLQEMGVRHVEIRYIIDEIKKETFCR